MRVQAPALAILILTSTASAQELTIVSKSTNSKGEVQMMTSYVSPDRLRLGQPGDNEMMFDLKSGDMTVIETKKKTYYVVTQKDVDDMTAMIHERMNSPEVKKAMEQMKNLPPDQQKRMQEMMGGMFAMNVEKEGTTRTIAGYKCENWIVTVGQLSKSEECITTEVKLPEQTWARYKKISDNLQAMFSAMGPMASGFDKMREQMEKMKGFPLATKTTSNIMGREMVHTSEVTSITRGPIPASAWEIPAGYTKVENPMLQGLKQRR